MYIFKLFAAIVRTTKTRCCCKVYGNTGSVATQTTSVFDARDAHRGEIAFAHKTSYLCPSLAPCTPLQATARFCPRLRTTVLRSCSPLEAFARAHYARFLPPSAHIFLAAALSSCRQRRRARATPSARGETRLQSMRVQTLRRQLGRRRRRALP